MTSNQTYIFYLMQDCGDIKWFQADAFDIICIEAELLQQY